MNDILDLTIFSPPGCGISHKASILILSLEFSLSLNFTENRTMKRTIFPQSKKKKKKNEELSRSHYRKSAYNKT